MDILVGSKIRKIRLIAGLSQENVAQDLGMSTGNYGKIERGEVNISVSHLFKIAEVLKVKPIVFLEEEDSVVVESSKFHHHQTNQNNDLKAEINRLAHKLNLIMEQLQKKGLIDQ